jgi:aspartate/methionine/tyrosine aminotransferase
VGQWIAESPGAISLGQGVAFYPPPPEVSLAIQASLTQAPLHQYHSVQGIPELISALVQKLQRDNQVAVGADQAIVVTAGVNIGFVNAVLAITDIGDEIILNTPYYFNHEMAVRIAGCQPVLVPTDRQYQLQPQLISAAITPKTKAVVTISPNNPTGVIYPEADLREINQLCQQRGIYHIHDEAYDYFAYDQTPIFSPAAIVQNENHTISLFSFSKAYGMAGWRMGYMVIPQEILLAVKKIQDTNLICPAICSQYAALACLNVGKAYSQGFLPEIAHCRRELLNQLGTLPRCRVVEPKGAFYCFLQVDSPLSDLELVKRLITEFKVGVLPSSTFGITDGCYLRIAYGALRKETAQIAIERLVQGLKELA